MRPNLADLITSTEEILNGNFIFCAVNYALEIILEVAGSHLNFQGDWLLEKKKFEKK